MPNALIPIVTRLDSGLVKDLPSLKLTPPAFTDSLNMSFDNGVARKAKGEDLVFAPTVAPYFLMPAPSQANEFWIYAGLAKAFGFLGTVQQDITRISGDYTGGISNLWNGGMFNGIPFINNGIDLPQIWSTPALGTPLIDMTSWPVTQFAKFLGVYKSFFVALDVTKAGTRDGRMIKWSSSAPPGALPGSWDETDATKLAGEFTLPEGSDSLISGRELGNTYVIYTKRSTWAMDFIGGNDVFSFRKIFAGSGITAQAAAVQFRNRHLVVTQDDIIIHDLASIESVADQKVRRWLFDNMNDSAASLVRVISNPLDNEIWICFPYRTSFNLNRALVWNWKFDSWALRELAGIRAIDTSTRNPFVDSDIWDLAVGDWDSETATWDEAGVPSTLENAVLMSPPDTTGIVLVGNSFQFSGSNYSSFLERRGISVIAIGGGDFAPIDETQQARILQDLDRHRLGLGIKPIIEARDGTRVQVSFGSHASIQGPVTWKGPKTFTVGRDNKVDLYPSGKYLALRIEDKGNIEWKLVGYVAEVSGTGRY